MELSLSNYEMRLKHTFTIAHDSRSSQNTTIARLSDGKNEGLGEATDNAYYGVTSESMAKTLAGVKEKIRNYELKSPADFWEFVRPELESLPFAQCALDNAAHDLFARKQGKKLYEVLGLNPAEIPLTNFTIGIAEIPVMVAKMKEQPWPLYKIKLGTDHDLEIIRELRKHTTSRFRVDANCAWDAEQTVRYSHILKDLNVEFIEQPLPGPDYDGMEYVFKNSALPCIADESCIVESDVDRCIGRFHGINVKLMKCGGITPALRMLKKAKNAGMKTMVGCMTESAVGIAGIAHIAALLDYVDMDGTMLLADQIAEGVEITTEKVIFPDRPGIGVRMLV